MSAELKPSAHWYIQRGVLVIPLHTVIDDRCTCNKPDCSSPGKHPRNIHGLTDATLDPEQVDTWWDTWPNANIGAATGHIFDVIDVDGPTGYQSTLKFRVDGQLAKVITRRGCHLHVPPTGRGNAAGILPGIDYRGIGGYVVMPPSQINGAVIYGFVDPPLWGNA